MNVLLALKNAVFTLLVPGTAAVVVPWLVVRNAQPALDPISWPGAVMIALGVALYAWCLWNFATVGRGTPGPWDPPRRFVATGPYRWVRNPMYISALTVVTGEAWLFMSLPLAVYAALMFAVFHAFVVIYEEPTLAQLFDGEYVAYRQAVSRWIPRPPRGVAAT